MSNGGAWQQSSTEVVDLRRKVEELEQIVRASASHSSSSKSVTQTPSSSQTQPHLQHLYADKQVQSYDMVRSVAGFCV